MSDHTLPPALVLLPLSKNKSLARRRATPHRICDFTKLEVMLRGDWHPCRVQQAQVILFGHSCSSKGTVKSLSGTVNQSGTDSTASVGTLQGQSQMTSVASMMMVA